LLKENPSELLLMANRGELSIPTEYCFAVCTYAMQMYTEISEEEQTKRNY